MVNGILRSINTSIWDDPYIRGLSINQKLIWMYLLSNRLTSMAGIYEITIDKIVFDTSIKIDIVKSAFKKFEKDNKIYYHENYIVMRNHLKNHHMNTNMQKGAMHIIENLPDGIKIYLFGDKVPKTFDKLKRRLLNIEIKIDKAPDVVPDEPEKKIKYIKFDFKGSDDEKISRVKFTEEEWERFVDKFSEKFAIRCVKRLELWYGTSGKNHYGSDNKKMYSWVIDAVRDDIVKEKKKHKRETL